MEKRGAGEPGHERGVLHRVPEPEAAPAELVIGPPTSERDAERERTPGGQRPGPDPACPGGIDPPLDQRRDGEGEGHGEADITEIKEGGMEGEAGILQQRVEPVAVGRHRDEPEKRVGGEQDEGQECDADPTLDRQHPGAQARRQVGPEDRHHGAEQGQDQHPEHHRTLVIAPNAGYLVEQRFRRMGILGDVLDREIGHHIEVRKAGKGDGEEGELPDRRHRPDRHEPRVIAPGAPKRQRALGDRQRQGEQQGVMADFRDHGAGAPFHWPDFFRASATSAGM